MVAAPRCPLLPTFRDSIMLSSNIFILLVRVEAKNAPDGKLTTNSLIFLSIRF